MSDIIVYICTLYDIPLGSVTYTLLNTSKIHKQDTLLS